MQLSPLSEIWTYFLHDLCPKCSVSQPRGWTYTKEMNLGCGNGQVLNSVRIKNTRFSGPRRHKVITHIPGSCDACPDRKPGFLCHCPLSHQWPMVAFSMVLWLQCPARQRNVSSGHQWNLPGLWSIQLTEPYKKPQSICKTASFWSSTDF